MDNSILWKRHGDNQTLSIDKTVVSFFKIGIFYWDGRRNLNFCDDFLMLVLFFQIKKNSEV